VLLTGAACQAPSGPVATPVAPVGAPSPAAGPTAPPADAGSLVTSVPFFAVEPDSQAMRFVGQIQNRSAQAVEGAVIRWEAIDDQDRLIVAFVRPMPPIGPGHTFFYVHGSEPPNLVGVTKAVNLIVTDPGRVSTARLPLLDTSEVRLELVSGGERTHYRVTGRVQTGDQPVDRRALFLTTVLRDAVGAIVGGDYTFPENVPDRIAPRTAFTVVFPSVPATGAAVTPEIVAYPYAF
jgi:hypothetical protein